MISEKQFYELLLNNEKLKIPTDRDILELNRGKTHASVLVIVHFSEKIPSVILTKRSQFLSNHSGEISFPGGKFSSSDKSILDTAIRETYEEIGIVVNRQKIIGCLQPTYTYTSKILIYPFVAIFENIPDNLKPNIEVEQIISLPIEKLINCFSEDKLHSTKKCIMYEFLVDGYVVWGATARILKNLLDMIAK